MSRSRPSTLRQNLPKLPPPRGDTHEHSPPKPATTPEADDAHGTEWGAMRVTGRAPPGTKGVTDDHRNADARNQGARPEGRKAEGHRAADPHARASHSRPPSTTDHAGRAREGARRGSTGSKCGWTRGAIGRPEHRPPLDHGIAATRISGPRREGSASSGDGSQARAIPAAHRTAMTPPRGRASSAGHMGTTARAPRKEGPAIGMWALGRGSSLDQEAQERGRDATKADTGPLRLWAHPVRA